MYKEKFSFKMKTIVTITGIRPDFIRMANIFKLLDANFNHILIHTGQHYDYRLSDVFFEQLGIRQPNYTLNTGIVATTHYEQLSYLSTAIIQLFKEKKIQPDLILFLGDSNSSCCSLPLKKEGYKIGHIEAGMRSGDKRMLEEINRTVCDHCSDIFFVYHENYKKKLEREGITENVYVVGNTIVEICEMFRSIVSGSPKKNDTILVDIHRPENFLYSNRMQNILNFIKLVKRTHNIQIIMLNFKRTFDNMTRSLALDYAKEVKIVGLMGYIEYLKTIWDSLFIISDSGTAQEEPALLNTPVIVPRDFTERPESVECECSYMIDVNTENETWNKSILWTKYPKIDTSWLGDGLTSYKIIEHIKAYLK